MDSIKTTVKVVEFKINLSSEQKQRLDILLSNLKWVWNRGLAIIEWNHYQKKIQSYQSIDSDWGFDLKNVAIASHLNELQIKKSNKNQTIKAWGDCCHIEKKFRIDKTKAWLSTNIEYKPCVELVKPHWMTPVPDEWMGSKDIDVKKAFAQKRNPDHVFLKTKGVMAWVNDFCEKVLKDSWKAYLKGIRKCPKYKRKRDRIKTISLRRSANNIKLDGNFLEVPYIGKIKIKGVERIPKDTNIYKVAISQKATGTYLQLTCDVPVKVPSPTGKSVGFNIGCPSIFTSVDDKGLYRHIKAKRYLKIQQKKLKRLQRKKARQHKNSNNSFRTDQEIAKLHEKIARQRKGYNHKLSHDLTQEYDLIVCENINLQQLTRRVKLKESEDGTHAVKNNQKIKSRLNQGLLDNGLGQLREYIEAKSAEKERLFLKVQPQFTSQMCNSCGYIHKDNRKNQKFKCLRCGHVDHADRNAAKNILAFGLGQSAIATVQDLITEFPKFVLGIYPSLIRESYAWVGHLLTALEGDAPLRDAENRISKRVKQEGEASSPGGILKASQLPSHGDSKQKTTTTSRRSK